MTTLYDLFKRAYGYLKKLKETGEVRKQLESALQSLKDFELSDKELQNSGCSMMRFMEAHSFPLETSEFEELVTLLDSYFVAFRKFLISILRFGEDCNQIITFPALMNRLLNARPDVHDIINHFGQHYDPQTRILDLNDLPMLVKLYGKKGGWRDDSRLKENVSTYKDRVKGIVEKVKASKGHKYNIRDRKPVFECLHNLQRLEAEAKRFSARKEVNAQLRENAPDWYREALGVVDFAKAALKPDARIRFGPEKPRRQGGSKWPPGNLRRHG